MGSDCSCCGHKCDDRKEPEVKKAVGCECPDCHCDPCKCGEETDGAEVTEKSEDEEVEVDKAA